ncbi:MAG TPA: beta-propeller fold lactonase family protein [Stellaceae bacterium]|nr:beta-propeller fold lactonase family protein [Stellaceae bacterium]
MVGWRALGAVAALGLMAAGTAASAQVMIVGYDEKAGYDANGKSMRNPPGHDTVSIIDMSNPAKLRIVASLPVPNTIAGPPTNLAVSPARDIALVANSLKPDGEGPGYKLVPDDRVFVIDLKANPPAIVGTVTVGKQPSGLAIAPSGKLALVCNRHDGTLSVLSINGKEVKVVDTVQVGTGADSVSAVAITPDGKRALAVKSAANKVALLSIDGDKVTYDKHDLPVGIFPYNVAITPNGQLALTADNGNHGTSDGNVDTVTVIDLSAKHPHVIDHVTVGDSTEGLVISPKGNLAVSIEARGSNHPKTDWYHHPTGFITVLTIDGKNVMPTSERVVGALPEGGAFSADGSYLYIGNFISKNFSVFKVNGDELTDAGTFKLPGQPASVRAGPQ